MMMIKRRRKNQKGFTLIEMLVVLAIIGLLASYFLPGLMRKREDAKFSTALTMLQKDFPGAITSQVSRTNVCVGMTKQDLLDRGLIDTTVWNLPWTLDSATSNLVTIGYPIDSTDTKAASTLATTLSTSTNVSSAVATANSKVTVAYRCN